MTLELVAIVVVATFLLSVFLGAPYVPTKKSDLKLAFEKLYKIKSSDLLVDIGCGGGVVLREASRRGAKALGYEINPFLFLVSYFLSRNNKKIKVKLANYWKTKLPEEVTVIYVFSVDRDMEKIKTWVQNESNRLNKQLNLISLGFDIKSLKEAKQLGVYYLYVFNPLQSVKAQV